MKMIVAPLWLKIWLLISLVAFIMMCLPCIGFFQAVCFNMPKALIPGGVFASGVAAALAYIALNKED